MPSFFRQLFLFNKKQVDQAFAVAKAKKKIPGLTLLQASFPAAPAEQVVGQHVHGKLLVIIPRKAGKAHKRNLFRRRAKAIFYQHKLYQQPCTWIMLVYQQAIDYSHEQLEAFMLKQMHRPATPMSS